MALRQNFLRLLLEYLKLKNNPIDQMAFQKIAELESPTMAKWLHETAIGKSKVAHPIKLYKPAAAWVRKYVPELSEYIDQECDEIGVDLEGIALMPCTYDPVLITNILRQLNF